ncbi:hypothetical protein BDY19DRAFT_989164 [Irpex rosettiformis]|uniref:Uncharacterized protein n=1 Tax=Irpex rosettiformis TaxID=378272 RepID=A0ACB8UGW8_9APHY|nr:hypothetical protein BDY19DRAFT_989164 [Irpex rosettiformis]
MGHNSILTAKQMVFVNDTSIHRLGDDVLLQILAQLSPDDLVSLRKTCRYFYVLSRSRYLWHHILSREVIQERRPLPSYRKPIYQLGSAQLETLVRRALRLDVPCQQPTITKFGSRQSVQWIRLIHGQWVLVATTDKQQSILTLYSLAVTENDKPSLIAAVNLAGPVSSGEIQVHDDRLVIALCYQSPRRMVQVLSVQDRDGQLEFATLSTFEGLSHIRSLRNELVGCAVYGDTQSPCVANWKTGEVAFLPISPDGPGQCLAMALREDICVVASSSSLTIYSISKSAPELLQVIQLAHSVGSVSVSAECETLQPEEGASARQPTRMLLFTASSVGINVLRLRQQQPKDILMPPTFSVDVLAEEDLKRGDVLSSKPSLPHFGGSTSRLSWIYAPSSFLDRSSASLVTGRFATRDSPPVAVPTADPAAPAPPSQGAATNATPSGVKFEILSECKDVQLPSLHMMPVMDYDDGTGIVAIGNGLGELVVCNYGGPVGADVAECFMRIPVPVVG